MTPFEFVLSMAATSAVTYLWLCKPARDAINGIMAATPKLGQGSKTGKRYGLKRAQWHRTKKPQGLIPPEVLAGLPIVSCTPSVTYDMRFAADRAKIARSGGGCQCGCQLAERTSA